MDSVKKSVLLIAMPFSDLTIPPIQLPTLEGYAKEQGIEIHTRYLYLKAAEFYGIHTYNFLINPPNNPYLAQMAFSKYVFPKHWQQVEQQCRTYFTEKILKHFDTCKTSSFENYLEQTDCFYHWVVDTVNWSSYDIIGFIVNCGQLVPSLAIAKKIKEQYPEKKIIFSGDQTADQLGVNVLEAFDFIDFAAFRDSEEVYYRLASDFQNYDAIPHITYRAGNDVFRNHSNTYTDLDMLPISNLDSFYWELNQVSEEVRDLFDVTGRFPVEISRGCWWNKCTFCNINVLQPCYREKNIKRIVEEIDFLSEKYTMNRFQLIGNTLPKKEYRLLFEEIINLQKNLDLSINARTSQLTRDDYRLMKEAGFKTIQIGIESFSNNYLKKMNTGVRVIDNIAALNYCKENGIKVQYNLLVNYPNEEPIDFEETKKNIHPIKQYFDPPHLRHFVVQFGSSIYHNPAAFNIEKLEYTDIDTIMFPQDTLEKNISYFYNFKRKNDLGIYKLDNW